MHLSEQLNISHEQYGLLFDVRRSVRYHDRRRAFYEQLHQITSLLTVLMAGSVFFDLAKPVETANWLQAISVLAAIFAALDMVIGYSKRALLHSSLRERFALLEIDMVMGDAEDATWLNHQRVRLMIEKDEPPVYKVLDGLCRNELLEAEGYKRKDHPLQFFEATCWQQTTSQLFRWENVSTDHDEVENAQPEAENKPKGSE